MSETLKGITFLLGFGGLEELDESWMIMPVVRTTVFPMNCFFMDSISYWSVRSFGSEATAMPMKPLMGPGESEEEKDGELGEFFWMSREFLKFETFARWAGSMPQISTARTFPVLSRRRPWGDLPEKGFGW